MQKDSETRLAVIRKDRGLSQKQLAQRIGIPVATIELWESSDEALLAAKTRFVFRIAKTLDISITTLIS